ncbi:putative carbonic anhydrase [Aspergillus steynii IBT 23096]|uniref:Carbonic anhydrase n=1 Tax=Aspergillus steynii IBT 23096 TaxID=1392250 RepID=A0A2I2GA59_9EURO|nr:putative carbonic anhydrase [Aspergillus steynii IBT 23096]PLB49759.1 putative carbonic anhydrase [Aspergillus steynii IBT 23096]
MPVADEFESANATYAASFTKGNLQLPPKRKVAILTCMDARIADPAKALGLSEGDAHVIRNAGGRASDALRSIIISQQLLGTREIVIIHHTNCGMLTFSDDQLRSQIRTQLGQDADHIAFLPFKDLRQSVLDDVAFLKKSELVLDVPVTGFVYEVESGRVVRV